MAAPAAAAATTLTERGRRRVGVSLTHQSLYTSLALSLPNPLVLARARSLSLTHAPFPVRLSHSFAVVTSPPPFGANTNTLRAPSAPDDVTVAPHRRGDRSFEISPHTHTHTHIYAHAHTHTRQCSTWFFCPTRSPVTVVSTVYALVKCVSAIR